MTGRSLRAQLWNAEGELIAEGPCWLDEPAGVATLEPEREPGVLQKERGALTLGVENGRSYAVSDRPMIMRLGPPRRRKMFRLRLIASDDVAQSLQRQDASAAGDAGEGPPAHPERETPAAR